jgi:hypothetical protein
MSQAFSSSIADITIANGAAVSRSVRSLYEYMDATAITLQAPSSLDALTFTIETSTDDSTWTTLSDGTADIGPPAAGKSRQYTEMIGSAYFRIKASGNVAADRTFKAYKQWTA